MPSKEDNEVRRKIDRLDVLVFRFVDYTNNRCTKCGQTR
jgi:hypothetical protein